MSSKKKKKQRGIANALPLRALTSPAHPFPDYGAPRREAIAGFNGAQDARVNDFVRITGALTGRSTVMMITGETAVAICGALRRGGMLRDGSRVQGYGESGDGA